jgi:hypothetical protein
MKARRKMKDMPMLDIDRERMRQEFEGFDDMTPEEFAAAATARVTEIHDLVRMIDNNDDKE